MEYENRGAGTEANENDDAQPSTPIATPAKQKGAAGRKRKADALTSESDDTTVLAGADETPTKPKRQRKTPAEKATGNGKNGARVKK